MFKIPGGLGDMFKQAQQLQQSMEELKVELEQKRVTGDAGAGMVQVTSTAACEVLEVKLDPQLLAHPDQAMIEDLIRSAVNDAMGRAKEVMKQEIGKRTGGLPIPGLS